MLEEEIDFEGLSDYIRGNMIEDIKLRCFGNKRERGLLVKALFQKPEYMHLRKLTYRLNAQLKLSLILRMFFTNTIVVKLIEICYLLQMKLRSLFKKNMLRHGN